jgi:hypothetical protein
MSESDQYSYAPLDSSGAQIRLLKVAFDVKLAMGHKNGNGLAVSMETYYLPTSTLSRTQRIVRSVRLPPYYALSYAWGDLARSHEIRIDGKWLNITENLYNGIRDLQRNAIGVIYIWADAICINQDDLAERSSQLLLMREIYHTAADVQIWLGPCNADGKRCMRFISALAGDSYDDIIPDEDSNERFMEAFLAPTAAVVNAGYGFGHAVAQVGDIITPSARDDKAILVLDPDWDQKTVEQLTKWRPSNRTLKKLDGENFGELASLIDLTFIQHCSWFERMWVVQELGVADSARILYDGKSIPWKDFLNATYYLHYTCKLPLPNVQKLTGLEKIRLGWMERKRLSLYDLIRECQYRQASDPRDRIYALFGLMGDRMNSFLQPDYTKSVGEVYALATQHFIIQSASLDPICGWQAHGRRHIPSWIPDYSLDQRLAASSLIAGYGRENLFSASGHDHRGKYNLDSSGLKDWNCLHTTGLLIDSVAVSSANICNDAQMDSVERIWRSTIIENKYLLQKCVDDLEPSLHAVSTVVSQVYDFWKQARPSRTYKLQSYSIENLSLSDIINQHQELISSTSNGSVTHITEAYIQLLLCGRGTNRTRLGKKDIQAIMHLKIPQTPTDEQTDAIHLICKALENGMNNRLIAITQGGYFVALPEMAQRGDLVCVLFGCSVPVVLRRLDEHNSYTFIGECYLHGFMDGEAIAMQVKKEIKEQEIILK